MNTRLRGDRTLRRQQEPTPPSINQWVGVAVQWYGTGAPTKTQRDAYEYAAAEFEEALGKLRKLIEDDLVSVEKQLEEAGAPWTPGRVPVWSRE